MNKVAKSVLSVFCASAVLFSFYTPSTFASDTLNGEKPASEIQASEASAVKIPDALNPELEKQKLKELQDQKKLQARFSTESLDVDAEDSRLYVIPGQPLVINFDDGSSITYESKVLAAQGNRNFVFEKTYSYVFGTATIDFRVQNCTVTPTTGGYKIDLSGNSNDINQFVVGSTLSTVQPGNSEAKTYWTDLYNNVVKYRGSGLITYIQGGIYKSQSYEMIFECTPNGMPYIVSSY